MDFDLAALVRNVGTYRRDTFTARAIEPTRAQYGDLLRIYMRLVRAWQAAYRETIAPLYARSLSELVTDDADELASVFGATEKQIAQLAEAAGFSVSEFTDEMEAWHRRNFAQAFTPVGVNIGTLLTRGDVRQTLQAVVQENVSLIRSLNDQMRNGTEGAVFRGLQNRTPAREVAREIRKLAGIGQRRAELIASDQLAKLTSRLDEQRQRQAGMSKFEWKHSGKTNYRPDHLARDGKTYEWGKGVGASDPPGRAIRCGCRAQAVLEIDDEVTAEPTPAPTPPPPPPPPPPAPASFGRPRRVVTPPPEPRRIEGPAGTAAGRGFRSPVNPDVNDTTLQVGARLALQKQMTAELAEAARDPRYEQTGRWSGRSESDYGKAKFSTAWNDEAVSVVAAVKPELDDLADQIGIPRLRGFKTTAGSQNADMGGGVMALSADEFNARSARVGGGSADDLADKARAEAESLLEQQRALRPEIESLAERMFTARQVNDPVAFAELKAKRDPLVKEYDKLYKKRRKLSTAAGRANRVAATAETKWRPGDDPKNKPWSVAEYYPEGMDRARSTLFHEFAHHVHQNLNRVGTYNRPLETKLRELFAETRDVPGHRDRLPSRYGHTNQHEWFAESFSLFVMGKKELADPVLVELIERIFRGEF